MHELFSQPPCPYRERVCPVQLVNLPRDCQLTLVLVNSSSATTYAACTRRRTSVWWHLVSNQCFRWQQARGGAPLDSSGATNTVKNNTNTVKNDANTMKNNANTVKNDTKTVKNDTNSVKKTNIHLTLAACTRRRTSVWWPFARSWFLWLAGLILPVLWLAPILPVLWSRDQQLVN